MEKNSMPFWEFVELFQLIEEKLINKCIDATDELSHFPCHHNQVALEQAYKNLLNSDGVHKCVCLDPLGWEEKMDKLKLFVEMLGSLEGKYTFDKYTISVDKNYKFYNPYSKL